MKVLCAGLARLHNIPPHREFLLTHAEVQAALGIRQRGKWDITWLPDMAEPGEALAVGDRIRGLIRAVSEPVRASGSEGRDHSPG